MCYSERLTKVCEICSRPRAFEKICEHKCYDVLRSHRGFGRCGKKAGPYPGRLVRGLCPDCKQAREVGFS
ncbi:hypothetical protein LQW54_007179 [Pestalotiopsis sp. IQ-011]